jgi:hypothetical protein
VIERVVENWLTSVNERQYQISFCQLLAAEGETVVYISPHGQREQGKDGYHAGPRSRSVCLSIEGWACHPERLERVSG